ncbi:MAG: UxaA family hydrolase [Deltaproteobacteria bacterium]|nr:MAG: UxaA family hydrolase [Deltaproteobacteria bacterium]
MKPNAILINPKDNVAVVLEDIPEGNEVILPGRQVLKAREDIPSSHKVAVRDIPEGAELIKYGEMIGAASVSIAKGDWVHTHNLKRGEQK